MGQSGAFRIVIAYENCGSAVRAKELTEQLAEELKSGCDSWEFELLALERVRQTTALIAAEADMIVIAASGDKELPESVLDWIESWLPQRKAGRGILVALLGQGWGNPENPLAPGAYLRWIAGRAEMDFLCNLGPSSEADPMDRELSGEEQGQAELPETPAATSHYEDPEMMASLWENQ